MAEPAVLPHTTAPHSQSTITDTTEDTAQRSTGSLTVHDSSLQQRLGRLKHRVQAVRIGELGWVCLAVLSHIAFGVFVVNNRFLETQATALLSPYRLTFYMAALQAICATLFLNGPLALMGIRSRLQNRRAAGRPGFRPDTETPLMQQAKEVDDALPISAPPVTFRDQALTYVAVAITIAIVNVANTFAVKLTQANVVLLINMMQPIWTTIILVVLGMPTQVNYRRLIPTVVVIVAGAALYIYGTGRGAGYSLSYNDVVGLCLALIGDWALSAYTIALQRSKGCVPNGILLYAEPSISIPIALVLIRFLDPTPWGLIFAQYRAKEWAVLLITAVVLKFGGNLLTFGSVRHFGAAFYTVLRPVEQIAGITASWLLLNEKVTDVWQWVGLALFLLAISYYLVREYQDRQRPPPDTELETLLLAAAAGAGDEPLKGPKSPAGSVK